MLKTFENNTISKSEVSRAKDSVREKLRAKIRQRIHTSPCEGDENVDTLNQDKTTRTLHERVKPAPLRNDKVSLVFPVSIACFSLLCFKLCTDGTECEERF